MVRLLPITSITVVAAVAPMAIASGDSVWTQVGQVGALVVSVAPDRYVFDEANGRLSVAMRLDGDFDHLMEDAPEEAAKTRSLRFGGVRRMEMDFVHDCSEGLVTDVKLRAAYDDLGRRTPAWSGLVALLERSARDAMRAISTPIARAEVRRACETRGFRPAEAAREQPEQVIASR